MDHLKKSLIERAKKEHKEIFPTVPQTAFGNDSFTTHDNKLLFWFNTKDNSTKMIAEHITGIQGDTGCHIP